MVATFTVPGTVTLKQVVRKPAGETPAQRLHRLAQKAVIEGCQVIRLHGADRLFAVTSSSAPDTAYVVDVAAGECSCDGFARHRACKHLALALAELGELPDLGPAAPVSIDAYRDARAATLAEVG